MKILVFGAGAIGSVFGGFLSKEHDVYLVGRNPHIERIKAKGLRVSGIWGSHTFRFKGLAERVSQIKAEVPFDLVLVTVKSYDTLTAARALRPLVSEKTIFLSLQNGIGNIEKLEKVLPSKQIIAGRVIFGVEFRKPGRVKVTVIAQPTAIGETHVKRISSRVRRIVAEMKRAGLQTEATSDVLMLLWLKVVYNGMLNPLASIVETHYGKLGECEETREMMNQVADEIYDVARKHKIRFKPASASAYKTMFYKKLLPATYHHHPSMLQDLQKGKKTEIHAMNGMIVKLAKQYKMSVPVNEFLVKLIKMKEKGTKVTLQFE